MVEISAALVKELREKTGAAMMDCKRALVQAGGDLDKACEVLRQEGVNVASKKASRLASEGLVVGKVAEDGKSAVILEVNSETDFVARNEEFVSLTKKLTEIALKTKAKTVEEFFKSPADGSTVEALISQSIAKTGENIVVRRISFFDLGNKPGLFGLYIHSLGGKIGALVKFETSAPLPNDTFSREVAMHVVFAKPQYLSKENVPADVRENEKRIESGKADLAEKKPEMRDKIIAGRLDKLIAERCLLEQPFVKEPTLSVSKYIEEQAKQAKTEIKVTDYSLMILGEKADPTESPETSGEANPSGLPPGSPKIPLAAHADVKE
jgi:elongation factor Ts